MTIKIKINGATLIDAKNPRWMDEEKTSIVLECKFSHYADMGMKSMADRYLKKQRQVITELSEIM